MGRRTEGKAEKRFNEINIDGTSIKDRRFKTHVRHFYQEHRGGLALAGTLALIYDRKDDVVYMGSSPVHPVDAGRATKRHGYRTAITRAVKAYNRKAEGKVDTPRSFFFHASEIPDSNPIKPVLDKWVKLPPGEKFDRKPHEEDETWLNGRNLMLLYAIGMSMAENAAWGADEEDFILRSMARKWGVLNRFEKAKTE